jgi:hypothetical protein
MVKNYFNHQRMIGFSMPMLISNLSLRIILLRTQKLLFDEDSQPSSCSNFDGHEDLASPNKLEIHTTEKQYFLLGPFCRDLQMKKKHVLSVDKYSFSKPEVFPYLISPSPGNHRFFLGSLISSQISRSSGILSEDEDESSSICSIPIQRWMDQACGYSFQQYFLPPTHLHELFL